MLEEEVVFQRYAANTAKNGRLHKMICITSEAIDDVCRIYQSISMITMAYSHTVVVPDVDLRDGAVRACK